MQPFLASPSGVQPAMNDTPGACQNRRVTEPQRELSPVRTLVTDEGLYFLFRLGGISGLTPTPLPSPAGEGKGVVRRAGVVRLTPH